MKRWLALSVLAVLVCAGRVFGLPDGFKLVGNGGQIAGCWESLPSPAAKGKLQEWYCFFKDHSAFLQTVQNSPRAEYTYKELQATAKALSSHGIWDLKAQGILSTSWPRGRFNSSIGFMAIMAVKDGQLQLSSRRLPVLRNDLMLVGDTMAVHLRKLPDSPRMVGFPEARTETKFALRSVRVAALDDKVDMAQLISVCERLKGVIRVPISVDLRSEISLSRLGRSEAQPDPEQVIAQLRDVNHAAEGEAFFGVTSRDLAARGLKFVFSSTDPLGYSVISTYRMKGDPGGVRLEKQFKKQLARLAGLRSSCGLMGTPLSVAQLDAMPADYCAQDLPALKKLDFLRDRGR